MKSRIWRLAGVGLLCLSVGAPVLADGPEQPGAPQQAHPQGQPQARPQPGNQGQQAHPQNNTQVWQNRQNEARPPVQQQQQQQQQHQQMQQQHQQERQQAQQQQQGLPIQGRPDTVRQTQEPIRGNYPDLQRNNGGQHWQAGGGQRPGNDNRGGNGRGNGWGPGPQYRPGQMVDRFPGRYDRVPYRGTDYFFSDGYWYRPEGPRYVVVAPPYGARTRYLPDYATQVAIGGGVLFMAAGTYYQYEDSAQDYVVVNSPEQGQPVYQQPPVYQQQPAYQAPVGGPYDVSFYPANGQPPQQVEQDRFDCQRWGAQQSGFDPAAASYAPAPEVVNIYRQAMANCLASRGYSVN